MKNLTVLGSTGSVGCNTLKVVEQNLDKFNVYALVAKSNVSLMIKQCLFFHPTYVCMVNTEAAIQLKNNLSFKTHCTKIQVLSGIDAACMLASLKEVDIVMSAIVGIAGLLPTFFAIRSGKQVLLANKESLITCGSILIQELQKHNACLLPVDSEHSAIFQSLPISFQRSLGRASLKEHGISRIILTASGGPFFYTPISQLSEITPEQACNHPNWAMGQKISIDSATMMNKGLEYIAARWLFNASAEQIEICLHPQSIIHSMVNYIDGSILAQLSVPDMRISIAYAMAYPERIISGVPTLNFIDLKSLNFYPVDNDRYPCLRLAIAAGNYSQSATIILNAANEVAVEAFLCNKIKFTNIANVVEQVLDSLIIEEPRSIDEVLWIDRQAREKAMLSVGFFSN